MFETLVDEAIKLVPVHAPVWTDHNRHDPGVTLIELFAWLTEMQQYYLNRLTPQHFRKFLKLLGLKPKAAESSRADVTFSLPSDGKPLFLPRGVRVAAEKVVFETETSLLVVPIGLQKLLSSSVYGWIDHTEANAIPGLVFYPFGEGAEQGNRFYIGFGLGDDPNAGQRPYKLEELSLTFDLFEDYTDPLGRLSQRGAHGTETPAIHPSGEIIWEYYGLTAASGQDWIRLDAQKVTDETLMFSQPGRVHIICPSPLCWWKVGSSTDRERLWVRATVLRGEYELPPKINALSINTVSAVQQSTLCEVLTFSGIGESQPITLTIQSYLALAGHTFVQVRERDGLWKDWMRVEDFDQSGPADCHYVLQRDEASASLVIRFGEGIKGRTPSEDVGNIRVISSESGFERGLIIGKSNGLPGQTVKLETVPLLPQTLMLQVAEIVRRPPHIADVKDLRCCGQFERTVPTLVPQGEEFVVKVTFRIRHSLAKLKISEALTGNLTVADGGGSVFEWQNLRQGTIVEHTYHMRAGEKGGIIAGSILFAVGCESQPVEEASPASLIDVGEVWEETRWRDYVQVDDFDASKPTDPHFVLDEQEGTIRFGDGVNGLVPRLLSDPNVKNFRLISCQIGGGAAGNVFAGRIRTILGDIGTAEHATAENRRAAEGGSDRETLEESKVRLRKEVKTRYRAVTSEDFEEVARCTPGLRVARAKALVSSPTQSTTQAEMLAAACVSLVVVPYSENSKPIPSPGFMKTVEQHVQGHCLVTTHVRVIPPEYTTVAVNASAVTRPRYNPASVQEKTESALKAFLHPIIGGPGGRGWPFGRKVYRSEIYEVIEKVEGVDYVEKVTLNGEGAGATRDAEGNIVLQPQALVAPGAFSVEVAGPQRVCRVKGT